MVELLGIYRWTILSGGLLASALALLGCHLAARDRATQTLCVAQGATLGALLGIGVLHSLSAQESRVHYSPLFSALAVAALAFAAGEGVSKGRSASRNTYLVSLFVALLAASMLVSALFPALESHMAQVFFGDLATLTDRDAGLAAGGATLALAWLVWRRRWLASQTFEMAVVPEAAATSRYPTDVAWFGALSLALLALSVQFVGLLFTAGCLFLPTALLAGARTAGLSRHLITCSAVAAVGSASGFALSLFWPRLPTVPTIVAVILLLAGSARAFSFFAGDSRSRANRGP